MAAPVRMIPALSPQHQSTEHRLNKLDAKLDRVIAQLNELIATTHRLAAHLDGAL